MKIGNADVLVLFRYQVFLRESFLRLAWEAGFKEVYCETDCHEAYVLLKDSNIPFCSQESVFISKIQHILLWPWRIELNLIQRTANVADAMTKHATIHGMYYAK
ncbi:hypothetical protein PIB30_041567, partial [Stylosanthes scabra]|nr:hypothetical protein [Stylosanthes scabra]